MPIENPEQSQRVITLQEDVNRLENSMVFNVYGSLAAFAGSCAISYTHMPEIINNGLFATGAIFLGIFAVRFVQRFEVIREQRDPRAS